MIKIDVLSDERVWSKKIKKKKLFFNNLCKLFPKKYQYLNKEVSLTLLLSNNQGFKILNKNFRTKNKSTDILSFPFNKKIKISKNTYLGDIIISYDYLDKPKFQDLRSFKQKAIRIFIHGFLHLLGFNHVKNKDYFKMLREENFIYKHVKSKIN